MGTGFYHNNYMHKSDELVYGSTSFTLYASENIPVAKITFVIAAFEDS